MWRGGQRTSEWGGCRRQPSEGCPHSVLFCATTRLPPPPHPQPPFSSLCALRPALTPPCSTQTPRLRASLRTPSPSRPRPFPLNNLIPPPSPTEPCSPLSCLPAAPSSLGPPLGLSPGPGRSDPRTPSLGPGPLLTSQTSAPETEPERYTGTGNPPTALRPAVVTATAAATPRSSTRDGEGRATGARSRSSHFPGGGAHAWRSPEGPPCTLRTAFLSPAKSN